MTPGAACGIDTLDQRLAATTAAVAESRRRVERGHSGDAGTLAELVGTVLREADPRSTVRPAATRALLVALLDEVQTFMEAIERERATAGMHLRDLAARGRAGQAYGAGR